MPGGKSSFVPFQLPDNFTDDVDAILIQATDNETKELLIKDNVFLWNAPHSIKGLEPSLVTVSIGNDDDDSKDREKAFDSQLFSTTLSVHHQQQNSKKDTYNNIQSVQLIIIGGFEFCVVS